MKHYFCVLCILTVSMLFLGCQDKITNTFDNDVFGEQFDARVVGTVHGTVTAQGTGVPMQNVRIVYVVNNDTRTTYTNEDGYYRCDGLHAGTYLLTYYPNDNSYSILTQTVVVTHDSSFARPSQRDIYVNLVRNVVLYRNNATVEGYVNLRPNNDTTFLSAGAEVTIIFQNDIIPNVFRTVTTNPYGFYRFTNLPAVGYGVSVRVEARIVNGVRFAAAATPNFNLLYNDTVMAPNINQVPEVLSPLQVINSSFLNRGAIPVGTVLILDFNRPIVDLGQISLTDVSQLPNVVLPIAVVVENNGIRVRIVATLSAATNYRLFVRLRGVEDYSIFSGTYNFSTQ